MEFIFVQFGDTEETVNKNGETSVILSKKGEKTISATARGLNRIIPRKVKVQVWSSMACPASDSAEAIAEELGVKRKFLRTLDSDDLQAVLSSAFDNNTDDCIVIVGCNETLQSWIQKLTGILLDFDAGAAAGLSIDPEKPDTANLRWFLQAKILKSIS